MPSSATEGRRRAVSSRTPDRVKPCARLGASNFCSCTSFGITITQGPRRASARRIAAVDHVRKLRRVRDLLNIFRDIREHAVEVQLLLVAAAAHRRFRLPADGEDRHMVEFGVVEAGDQVGGARTASCEADAQLARELCVGHGHEGAHLLVARLDEVDLAIALDGADHAVDAVSGIAVDSPDLLSVQAPWTQGRICNNRRSPAVFQWAALAEHGAGV